MIISALSGFAGGVLIGYFRKNLYGLCFVFVVSMILFFLIGLYFWGVVRTGSGSGSVVVIAMIYSLFGGGMTVTGVWWSRKRDLRKV